MPVAIELIWRAMNFMAPVACLALAVLTRSGRSRRPNG